MRNQGASKNAGVDTARRGRHAVVFKKKGQKLLAKKSK